MNIIPRFRKRSFLASLVLYTVVLLPVEAAQAHKETHLVLFNWDEYIDPEVIEEFRAETGIGVTIQSYDTDESKDEILAATARGQGFDMMIGSGPSMRSYNTAGWLAKLPEDRMPNLKHVDGKWRDTYPTIRPVAVPYFWGTVGIAYRADLAPRPESWMDFFRPVPVVRGKVLLIDDSKDAVGMALKALGYSILSNEPAELAQASSLLQGLKPHLREIGYFNIGEDSSLGNGDILMAMAYSGDVLAVREHFPDVDYVVPKEGTNLWVDYLAVFDVSPHKQEAFRFIDYLNQPKIAARNAEYVHYASPNRGAEKFLSAEYLSDPILYPPAEVLQKSETYNDMTVQGARQRSRILSDLAQ